MYLIDFNFNDYNHNETQVVVSKIRNNFPGAIIAVVISKEVPNHPYPLIRVELHGVVKVGSVGEWDRAIPR
jgi:hypothetical protein